MSDHLNFSHQKKIFDPKRAKKVLLIGAGAVGSCVAFELAKMGVTDIEVWDPDTISSHNVPMSMYRQKDCERLKVEALAEIIEEFSGVSITTTPSEFLGIGRIRNASVIACVDSMSARANIWDKVKGSPTVDIFCDTRTAGTYTEVYAFNPNDRKIGREYAKLLYPDEEAAVQVCGYHGTMYASYMTASIAVANVTASWMGKPNLWQTRLRCDLVHVLEREREMA